MVNDHKSNEKIMHVAQFIEKVNELINSHPDKKVHFYIAENAKDIPIFADQIYFVRMYFRRIPCTRKVCSIP